MLFSYGGLIQPSVLVLNLADGTRQVIPLMCGNYGYGGSIAPDGAARFDCEAAPNLHLYGPSEEPTFG